MKRNEYTEETAFYAARDYNDAIGEGYISGTFDSFGEPVDAAWRSR